MVDTTILDEALTPKARTNGKSDKIWVGVSLSGKHAEVVKQALAEAGVTNRSGYVMSLILADLKRRLAKKNS